MATDLPVRVLTAWRTAEGAGTDLSDLQGYSGRVAIDLTVQNLTVRPQVLSYDVDRRSRDAGRAGRLAADVTASTGLGDLAPAASSPTTRAPAQRHQRRHQPVRRRHDRAVGRAARAAGPSSSAELSLVVDAKDFDVPDLRPQRAAGPGHRPSIGALVDSAFNPGYLRRARAPVAARSS